jgi:hypothetical protein
MPEVAFVMSEGQHYALRELVETLQYELGQQTIPSALHLGEFPEPRPSLVYVLLDPHSYVARNGEQALPDDGILRRTVFLCAEPLPTAIDDQGVALLRRAGAVFAPDQRLVLAMHRLGIPACLIRPGYSAALDRFDSSAARPIDVMFLGAHSRRRTKYLSRAARVLARQNCQLHVSDGTPSPGDTRSFLGPGRWPLLAQTKVLISLHRDEGWRFDWPGALDAIHAGAVVVTEPSSGIAPLVPGEHLVVAGADSLPYVVEDLLSDEQRLIQLRSQAYERLRTWIPYALPVAVLRAAIVELVGEPVPPGASLGRLSARPDGTDSSARYPPVDRQRATEPLQSAAPKVEVSYESPRWASRRAPLVTAITALPGHDQHVRATLDSLADSRLRDFELVIVDGGSSERTHATVVDWVSQHSRVAAQLIVAADTGLGAARKTALDFARGRFVLILDPGQELFPRCLEVLTGTLDAMSEMAFVYPMQEVIGDADAFVAAGGDHLLSFLGWDPAHLRLGNPIHAPALVRTARLRELGGFATDADLAGFEDYDLWCRMAERGWRGQLVPQVLARRTESGSSRTLSAIHPSFGHATTALMERAPTLMAGAFGAPAGRRP